MLTTERMPAALAAEKEVLMNSTNRRRIAKRFWDTIVADGTPCHGRINLLSGMGLAVRLDSEPCRDPSDGTMTVGLRVSLIDPDPAPAAEQSLPVMSFDQIEGAVKWMKDNGKTVEDVKKLYTVSQSIEDALIDAMGSGDDLPL